MLNVLLIVLASMIAAVVIYALVQVIFFRPVRVMVFKDYWLWARRRGGAGYRNLFVGHGTEEPTPEETEPEKKA